MEIKIDLFEDLKLPVVVTKQSLSPTESNDESSESGISSLNDDPPLENSNVILSIAKILHDIKFFIFALF